jgi:hypothetical protein
LDEKPRFWQKKQKCLKKLPVVKHIILKGFPIDGTRKSRIVYFL